MNKIIKYWHNKLDMPKNDLNWHRNDIEEECVEYREALGIISKWSELSDVVYTYTRAKWSGHKDVKFPFNNMQFLIGALYMFPKYSLRWSFYNKVGKKFNKNLKITEVRNPQKIEKLDSIAKNYNLNPQEFKFEAQKLMKHWIFLK